MTDKQWKASKVSNDSEFELGRLDSAVIFRDNGEIELHIPNMDDRPDDPAPDSVMAAMLVAALFGKGGEDLREEAQARLNEAAGRMEDD